MRIAPPSQKPFGHKDSDSRHASPWRRFALLLSFILIPWAVLIGLIAFCTELL
jgi:hypothetical protein